MDGGKLRLAVLIPCYNEALTIAKVVADVRLALPDAGIFVFDNNSTDDTAKIAHATGVKVIRSPRQGKGYVIRHAFQIIEADFYILIDGDDTYPIEEAHKLIKAVDEDGYAMACGIRLAQTGEGRFRRFHVLGNHFLSSACRLLFGAVVGDMLTGFRVLSKDFVDGINLRSRGFEIETDLTLQAITKNFPMTEIPVSYRSRPPGSFSKLRTFEDGFLILYFMVKVMKDYRPLPFFSFGSAVCVCLSLLAGTAPIRDYIMFKFVYTVPLAILAASLMILAFVLIGVGLILDSQIQAFQEQSLLLNKILKIKSQRSDKIRDAA